VAVPLLARGVSRVSMERVKQLAVVAREGHFLVVIRRPLLLLVPALAVAVPLLARGVSRVSMERVKQLAVVAREGRSLV
jgi:hypothetical protein